MVVAPKWHGTNADKHDMEKLQLDQVLRVRDLDPDPIRLVR
jgi:hypothetical protein